MEESNRGRSGAERVKPYRSGDPKGEQVEEMFDSIAPAYDRMNTAMTFGLHRLWRDRALRDSLAQLSANGIDPTGIDVLDVATGTGDLVFALHRRLPQAHISGIDLSDGMLSIARRKLRQLSVRTQRLLSFGKADCLALPYADDSFDLVTVAYGVRNFEEIRRGYEEMYRVLRPGGVICVVELSVPRTPMLRSMYDFYSRRLIPFVGRLASGDSRAYSYLPESIAAVPQRDDMTRLMNDAGFSNCRWRSLTFGAVCVYIAEKK